MQTIQTEQTGGVAVPLENIPCAIAAAEAFKSGKDPILAAQAVFEEKKKNPN